MNAVLEWVKKNVFIVVFIVLMVAALVALPIVSGRLNAGVQEEVKSRALKANDMKSLPTQLEGIPGVEPRKIVVNERLLDDYERLATTISDDADRVVAAALEHNRKGRGVLLPRMLPEPPPAEAQVLPGQFHQVLLEQYEELLMHVGAGAPPTEDAVQDELDRAEVQVRAGLFSKDVGDPLDPEEESSLREKLAAERLALYTDAATRIAIYASSGDLNLPFYDQRNPPSLTQVYHWQWQYWVTEDILRALYEANRDDQTVLRGPVKRVLWVQPWPMPTGASRSADTGSRRGGGRSRGEEGPTAAPPDPKKSVPLDYTVSFTGRSTNSLYDVQMVNLGLIVDSHRIPEVLDAIAAQNFMTVTSLEVSEAQPFEDVRRGFLYGQAPLSELTLQIETIWLREWTREFMPEELKRGLGIPTTKASSS